MGARHLCWEIKPSEQTAKSLCQSAVHVQSVLTHKVSAVGGESWGLLTSKSPRPRLATQLAPQQVKPLLQALSAATPPLGLQPYTRLSPSCCGDHQTARSPIFHSSQRTPALATPSRCLAIPEGAAVLLTLLTATMTRRRKEEGSKP